MKPRIILVEDHDSLRRSLERALVRAGYTVRSFDSAEALLEIPVAEIAAECLVIDVHLPGISGLELCRRLRARGVQTPFISMSSDHNELLEKAALSAGALAHLFKPFEFESMLEVMQRALPASRRA